MYVGNYLQSNDDLTFVLHKRISWTATSLNIIHNCLDRGSINY